jgi:hypothetical protein
MSSQSLSPDSSSPVLFIPKSDRPRFIFFFIAVTTLAGILSLYPTHLLDALLNTLYPSVQDYPLYSVTLLDILLGNTSQVPNYLSNIPSSSWIVWPRLLRGVLAETIFGASIGSLQWGILRQYLPSSKWILATILGFEIAGLMISDFMHPAIYYALGFRGLIQWFLLRRIVRDSWIWLASHPLAFLVIQMIGALFVQDILWGSWVPYSIVLGVLQSITFCIFYRKSRQPV